MPARTSDRPIDALFLERWSPRAFDRSNLSQEDLLTILEAARWAPSAFNLQPWHFLYAHRDDAHWSLFLSLLIPWNQLWARNASVLIYVLSDSEAPSKGGNILSHSHSYDAGAAWALLSLQATRMGYHSHGMTGIDFEQARIRLRIPRQTKLEAAIAIGRMGDPASLDESLRAREHPSHRKPLGEVATHGPCSTPVS